MDKVSNSLYDDYESYVLKYRAEYGEHCIVLYRCGQFYEIYSANDGLVDIKNISELLNIQVSRRNKAIIDVNRSNTMMAGFPMFALRKFVGILVDNNYTVVIVDQISDPPKPKRGVTEIVSPGTFMEINDLQTSSYLMCAFIEESKDWTSKNPIMCIGLSFIDVTTGMSHTFEVASPPSDFSYAFDEAYRIITSVSPKECIIMSDQTKLSFEEIVNNLGITSLCVHDKISNFNPEVKNINYQTQFLSKVFPHHGLYTVLEYLNLERKPFATISYVYLLQFTIKHNENILNHISRPTIMENTNTLQLHFNAARQLNILPNSESKSSLLTLLNTCTTAMGRRAFRNIILYPITDPQKLNERYDTIEVLRSNNIYEKIAEKLGNVYDIERLVRKMNTQRFHPSDFKQLDDSIQSVLQIFDNHTNICIKHFNMIHETANKISNMKQTYYNVLDMNEIVKYHMDNIDRSFFIKGNFANIDELQQELETHENIFNKLIQDLNAGNEGFFKHDFNERDGHHIVITSRRFNDFKKEHANKAFTFGENVINVCDLTSKLVSASSSSVKVQHKTFNKYTDLVNLLKTKLRIKVVSEFKHFVIEFIDKHEDDLYELNKFISDMDVACNIAKLSHKYNYFRPHIINKGNNKSYFECKNIRHPIIERLNDNVEYVTNDVSLGFDDLDGILLFGLNCSGKTSLSKAIALNIIMAQAGMYVPCNLTFFPYQSIFTRIPSGDDIFKAMSTFAVEMNELRNILKRSNEHSLIVGDEISHGTEVTSGVAIVGAAICELAKRKSTFIFATHLHNIKEVNQVTSLTNVKMFHLSVQYDDALRKLVFDRKLKEGPGSSVYGLEVCRALDLPSEFLELANKIRQENQSYIVTYNKSKYNSKIYFDTCQICGNKTQEIHHIREQHTASTNGFVPNTSMHVNAKCNLVNICISCHDKVHNDEIKIDGYIQTSTGVELKWCAIDKEINGDGVKNKIIDLKKHGTSINKIVDTLKNVHNIHISRYKVSKILSQMYD